MSRQILSLLVVALTMSMVYSLKCNLCMGPKGSDCANGEEKGQMIQTCLDLSKAVFKPLGFDSSSDLDRDISCVTYTSAENAEYTPGVIRGCGYIYKDIDICEYMQATGISTECESCNSDMCNI